MSKMIVSQQMEIVCEACGKKVVWEMVGADEKPALLQEMQSWFAVARKIVDPRTGQLTQLLADACGIECGSVLLVKLAVPPQTEQDDKIDLASLRVSNFSDPN